MIIISHNDDMKEKHDSHTSSIDLSEFAHGIDEFTSGYGESMEESLDDLHNKISNLILSCLLLVHDLEYVNHTIEMKDFEYAEVDATGKELYRKQYGPVHPQTDALYQRSSNK